MVKLYVTLMVVIGWMSACGDESSFAPGKCEASGSFSSVDAGFSGVYGLIGYEARLSEDCQALLSQNSGDFYYRLEASGDPMPAYLSAIDFGGQRSRVFEREEDAPSMAAGATAKEEEFVFGRMREEDRPWLLPWSDAPTSVKIYFDYPVGTKAENLPRSVRLRMHSRESWPY